MGRISSGDGSIEVTAVEKEVPIVDVKSLEDALTKVDAMADLFRSVGVFVLRGARFSVEDQITITAALGDIFSWNIHSMEDGRIPAAPTYVGGHSDREDREYLESPEDYVLDWHIEQVYYVAPILAGIWNMDTFTALPENGNTRFVDSADLYELYSEDEKDFLSKSIVRWEKPTPNGTGPFFTKVVDAHPISGKPILRVETDRGSYSMPTLALWSGKKPTEDQIVKLDILLKKLKDALNNDISIRYSQRWEEGDLLVADLFKMYHAVMGGFKLGQRKFTGINTRPRNYNNSMHTTINGEFTNE